MTREELENLLKDVEFVKKLNDVKSEDKACELFDSMGFKVTIEELKELFNQIKKPLNEVDLEKVAGGVTICPFVAGFGDKCTGSGEGCLIMGYD